jgi:hypothetical protein
VRDARAQWWAENLEKVKRRWAAGESAGLIASTTAGAPSRSGIMGKLHREGLLRGSEVPNPLGRKPRAPETEKRKPVKRKRAAKVCTRPTLRTVPYDPERARPITEVRGCLYPVEEAYGEHLFCNGPRKTGGPYCRAHAAITGGGFGAPLTQELRR